MELKFGLRLKELRCENNLKIQEFVDLYNTKFQNSKLSKSIVSRYENGVHSPKRFQIVANIAQFFDVDTDYLMGRSDVKKAQDTTNPNIMLIKVMNSISSNRPNDSNQYIPEIKASDSSVSDHFFYFCATDDSMMNSGIVKNSLVLFSKIKKPKNGDIVAFCINDGTIILRKYFMQLDTIALLADIANSSPIMVHKDDANLKILGTAVKTVTLF